MIAAELELCLSLTVSLTHSEKIKILVLLKMSYKLLSQQLMSPSSSMMAQVEDLQLD
jgi:hypothetical protein